MLKKPQEDSHWTFASPGPAYHLSQLDDVTRSLHFYRNSSRVSVVTQKNTFITSRGVWDSASRSHRDVPLDRYLKIGRQILTTASPHPNVSVLFGVEPFCRFHFARCDKQTLGVKYCNRPSCRSGNDGSNVPESQSYAFRIWVCPRI